MKQYKHVVSGAANRCDRPDQMLHWMIRWLRYLIRRILVKWDPLRVSPLAPAQPCGAEWSLCTGMICLAGQRPCWPLSLAYITYLAFASNIRALTLCS